MASISTDVRGNRSIQFVAHDRRRRTIRLGKVSMRDADSIRFRVEHLNAAKLSGHAVESDTASWLAAIGERLHGKLAAVGLVQPRRSSHLGEFLDGYISARVGKKADRTILGLKDAARKLRDKFGDDRPMHGITPADADDFRADLVDAGYAEATIACVIKKSKQFFRAASRQKLIPENPFVDVKAGSMSNSTRNVTVSRADTAKLIDACPDAEWRLIIALCRFGGLRCPSEVHVLKWDDVLWDAGRFTVNSPKTGTRVVPIFPELRPYFEACFDLALPGATHVIATHRNVNLRTRMVKIIARAGLVPWTRPFQNLRASRQNELTDQWPEHVVCAWIGNSRLVAREHYLQPSDEHFARAAETGAQALQKPVQPVASPCFATLHESQEALEIMPKVKHDEVWRSESGEKKYPRQESKNTDEPLRKVDFRDSALHEPVQLPSDRLLIKSQLSGQEHQRLAPTGSSTDSSEPNLLRLTIAAFMSGDVE